MSASTDRHLAVLIFSWLHILGALALTTTRVNQTKGAHRRLQEGIGTDTGDPCLQKEGGLDPDQGNTLLLLLLIVVRNIPVYQLQKLLPENLTLTNLQLIKQQPLTLLHPSPPLHHHLHLLHPIGSVSTSIHHPAFLFLLRFLLLLLPLPLPLFPSSNVMRL